MVWNLGKAMQKKEEFESARLMNFEFRQRTPATRHLASSFGLEESTVVREIAIRNEDSLLDMVAAKAGKSRDEVLSRYQHCLSEARQ